MIVLGKGDITQQNVDAIVNAANSRLAGGGGVDGAIHRAGGPVISEQCADIIRLEGSCPTGHAVITDGGNLKAKYVIHAVGPIWRGGHTKEAALLAQAYQSCLSLAGQYDIRSLAFPSISTGAYGFPIPLAAEIALQTISQYCQRLDYEIAISFVLFDQNTYNHYEKALASLIQPLA